MCLPGPVGQEARACAAGLRDVCIGRAILHHHHHRPDGVAYRSCCPDSSTFAVIEIVYIQQVVVYIIYIPSVDVARARQHAVRGSATSGLRFDRSVFES